MDKAIVAFILMLCCVAMSLHKKTFDDKLDPIVVNTTTNVIVESLHKEETECSRWQSAPPRTEYFPCNKYYVYATNGYTYQVSFIEFEKLEKGMSYSHTKQEFHRHPEYEKYNKLFWIYGGLQLLFVILILGLLFIRD